MPPLLRHHDSLSYDIHGEETSQVVIMERRHVKSKEEKLSDNTSSIVYES